MVESRRAYDIIEELCKHDELTLSEIINLVDRSRDEVEEDLRKMIRNCDVSTTPSWSYKPATKHKKN